MPDRTLFSVIDVVGLSTSLQSQKTTPQLVSHVIMKAYSANDAYVDLAVAGH